ncbi:YraN family protein [Cognatishimia activa]|uniref:YraN family protein n=1 Tax=Cognatishimia activa TaxID=1715691 RepID=UPI001FDF731F|nr:YraN family protein [Cognatishimia activa]MEE2944275.1 YraN family protein [Pseudomonadota bacterium]
MAGQAAEHSVRRIYQDRGFDLIAQRWRGGGGELDLVFRKGDSLTFVEVKKSRSHELAAQRVSQQQIHRIFNAASVFASKLEGGNLLEMQFDVALVDGAGAVQILENALMAF